MKGAANIVTLRTSSRGDIPEEAIAFMMLMRYNFYEHDR
jgi:hypothetical protein